MTQVLNLLVLHHHNITSHTHHTLTPHSVVTIGDKSLAEMDLEGFMESGFMSGSEEGEEEEEEGEEEEEEDTGKPKAKKPTMRSVFAVFHLGGVGGICPLLNPMCPPLEFALHTPTLHGAPPPPKFWTDRYAPSCKTSGWNTDLYNVYRKMNAGLKDCEMFQIVQINKTAL